jgi:hypothetical protein
MVKFVVQKRERRKEKMLEAIYFPFQEAHHNLMTMTNSRGALESSEKALSTIDNGTQEMNIAVFHYGSTIISVLSES